MESERSALDSVLDGADDPACVIYNSDDRYFDIADVRAARAELTALRARAEAAEVALYNGRFRYGCEEHALSDWTPCWFVEKPGSPTRWLVKTGASPATWTTDANTAQRFPDEWTAKREIRSMPASEGALIATEHSWFDAPEPPAAERGGWTEDRREGARADAYESARAELAALRARVAELEAVMRDLSEAARDMLFDAAWASALRFQADRADRLLTPKDPRP